MLRLRKNKNISIGRGVYIHRGSLLSPEQLIIGDYTRINGPIIVKGGGKVEIGKYCAFGSNIRIIPTNHIMKHANLQFAVQRDCGFKSLEDDRGPIIIGNNVLIGDMAIILPGTTVGDGAVIGAGTVVAKNIPPFSVVVGSPAQVVRKRFSVAVIRELAEIRWWDWTFDKIKRNHKFFEADLTNITVESLRSLIKE